MADLLSEALGYARRGWYVFPCREKPGEPFIRNGERVVPAEKTPYVAKGLNEATLDEDQIKAWWIKWPDALIGVNAGKSGLFVIDIDKKHVNGLDTFISWNINDGAGLHSITPSGGMHILFTGTGKSSTNAKTGIDTRGEGGYFIAPPSRILMGSYAGEYKAFDDWGYTPGIVPDGLMGKLFPDNTTEYVKGSSTPADGTKKQLSRATLNFLANGAPAGERNTSLFKALADFAGCGYEQEHTRETVLPAAIRSGLTPGEFETVLIHAYSKPRTPAIPDSIQEKLMAGDKNVANQITPEELAVMEVVVLSCLLIDNNLIPVIEDVLNFEDFVSFKNRVIYKVMHRIYASGMKADQFTVANELCKETDKITLDDISKMIHQYFINADNILTYAYIIRQKAAIRKLETILDNKGKYLKQGNLFEVVSAIEKDIADVAIYGGTKSTSVMSGRQATEMVAERTRKIMTGEIKQLKTGFAVYDKDVGGLFSNELVICAGFAGEGKSALLLSIINRLTIVENKSVALFSLEMSTHETICRLITQLTGLEFRRVYLGQLNEKEWKIYKEAMEKIADSKLHIDDGYGMTVPEIRTKLRKLAEKDLDLIGLDQLEQINGHEGQPDYIRFNRIAYEVKDFTKEFEKPVILIHQLGRKSVDRKLKDADPQLADLNQAGEKPSDQVWAIKNRKDEQGKIIQSKITMLKNRNGPKIEFAVRFVGERMLFSNPTSEEESRIFHGGNNDNTDEAFWEDHV
jgi:replicative DNA helicase